MEKEIEVIFDEEVEQEYQKLQEFVLKGKVTKGKPTYCQLLNSIDLVVENLKINLFVEI